MTEQLHFFHISDEVFQQHCVEVTHPVLEAN